MTTQADTPKRLRLIVFQDDSEDVEGLSNMIKATYPDHYQFSETVFVVAASGLTSEISKSLMSYGKSDRRSAGVFDTKILGISGYVDGDFWEWLDSIHETLDYSVA